MEGGGVGVGRKVGRSWPNAMAVASAAKAHRKGAGPREAMWEGRGGKVRRNWLSIRVLCYKCDHCKKYMASDSCCCDYNNTFVTV